MSDEIRDPNSDSDSGDGDPEKLIVTCIPSLVATLLNRERAKGSPLTEEEVLAIRDNCPAKALTSAQVRAVEERRGYQDIDPVHAWEQWQEARVELLNQDNDSAEEEDEALDESSINSPDTASQGPASPAAPSQLVIFIDPALAAVLHTRERQKGSPLTEEEVLDIRDNSAAIVLTPDEAAEREAARGFKDIDPERVWEEWQEVRLKLPELPLG